MLHLLWFLPLVAGLASIWSGRLQGIAMLVALICGLIGLAYLIVHPRGKRPPWAQQERDERDVEREMPPGPGW
jgi:hypothetical protein